MTTKQLAAQILRLARFARGCRIPHRRVIEIVQRETQTVITQGDYFAALDLLGTKLMRIRGQGGSICA